MVYDGSGKSVDPENPSAESAKITESLVLLELVADLYPDSGLLPKDPVERARVRFFIDAFSTKVFPRHLGLFVRGEDPDAFVAAVAEIQELLPPTAKFAVGDHYTIADAAIAPSIGRWALYLENDVGKYAEGAGPVAYQQLFQSERFARFQKYYANLSSRESFKNSFDSVGCVGGCTIRVAADRFGKLGNLVGNVKEIPRPEMKGKVVLCEMWLDGKRLFYCTDIFSEMELERVVGAIERK